MSEFKVVPEPIKAAMQNLVPEQIKKMNGSASHDFNFVATRFIKYAVVRLGANGRGTERANSIFSVVHWQAF
jgi:hypothetical protein